MLWAGGGRLMKCTAKEIGAVILMLLLGEVLFIFFYLTGAFYEHEHLSQYNSNAKLIYTNTANYMTKYEVSRGGDPRDMWVYTRDMDGVYWGSLFVKHAPEYSDVSFDGSSDDLEIALKFWQGSGSREWAGYYFIVIKDGRPVQCLWSKSEALLYCAEQLAGRAETNDLGTDVYNDGKRIGSYPMEMTDIVKKPPDWFKVTVDYKFRSAVRSIKEDYPKILTRFSPLIIYGAARLIHKIKRKNIPGNGIT